MGKQSAMLMNPQEPLNLNRLGQLVHGSGGPPEPDSTTAGISASGPIDQNFVLQKSPAIRVGHRHVNRMTAGVRSSAKA